jgi:formylglycine-generating enzyme required for sulfatase activity
VCIDDCAGRQCGASPIEGFDCGICSDGVCASGSCVDIFVEIAGGTFNMGSDIGIDEEEPLHPVTVPDFEIMQTEVTVAMYADCVNAQECLVPVSQDPCNWGVSDREDHPMTCLSWYEASLYCDWIGGRLPSEAEWEYAARSRGQNVKYPWGDASPTCQYAVFHEGAAAGCGRDSTWPVCSKLEGRTEQGLCDMAGNAYEWVQDSYHSNYVGAPSDGSAWESPEGDDRAIRGGSWTQGNDFMLRSSARYWSDRWAQPYDTGVRCVR